MSYPLLRISGNYAHVEVRKGKGAIRWRDMERIFSGKAPKGKEWKAGEGEKLSTRHCLWPSDPKSTLSQPYTVSSWAGLNVGKPETLVFPTSVARFANPDDEGAEDDDDESPAITLHEDPRSGNCHKIKLTAALLGLPLETRQYDIMKGETRSESFLRDVNANGRIPVLQIGEGEDARFLPESNAACWYLAEGSELIPEDRFARADMLRWMFFEQYNHEPNVATLRFWLHFVGEANLSSQQKSLIMAKRMAGQDALGVMDEHLANHDWFVGSSVTLADIALYPYTAVCEAGGFALSDFKNLKSWISRLEQLPGALAMR